MKIPKILGHKSLTLSKFSNFELNLMSLLKVGHPIIYSKVFGTPGRWSYKQEAASQILNLHSLVYFQTMVNL